MTVRRYDEHGSGLLGTVFGLAIVLILVVVASNVAVGLWTRSTVEAVAYDAARRVASTPAGDDAADRARSAVADARRLLGPYGSRVDLEFESLGPRSVVLHVRAPGATLLPRMVDAGPVVGALDRRVVIRREVDDS